MLVHSFFFIKFFFQKIKWFIRRGKYVFTLKRPCDISCLFENSHADVSKWKSEFSFMDPNWSKLLPISSCGSIQPNVCFFCLSCVFLSVCLQLNSRFSFSFWVCLCVNEVASPLGVFVVRSTINLINYRFFSRVAPSSKHLIKKIVCHVFTLRGVDEWRRLTCIHQISLLSIKGCFVCFRTGLLYWRISIWIPETLLNM